MDTVPRVPVASVDLGSPNLSLVKAVKPQRANTLANRVQEYLLQLTASNSKKTVLNNRQYLEMLERYMGGGRNRLLDGEHLVKWVSEMIKDGRSKPYLFLHVSSAKRFLKWLWKMRYISVPLDDYLPVLHCPPGRSLSVMITEQQYLHYVERWRHSDTCWAAVCAYHTGFRMKDVCDLRWEHVDLDGQMIRKVPCKSKTNDNMATIPILSGSDLHEWLLRMHAERDGTDEGYVSYSLYLKYFADDMSRRALACLLSRNMKLAGINASFHAWRGTFESRLANSGMNMAIAAKITGRTSPASLMRYIRADEQVMRTGVEKALGLDTVPRIYAKTQPAIDRDNPVAGQRECAERPGLDAAPKDSEPLQDFNI